MKEIKVYTILLDGKYISEANYHRIMECVFILHLRKYEHMTKMFLGFGTSFRVPYCIH